MEINEKASEFLKELCADIDFSKAGYRPPLKEPLILAKLDDEIMNKLEILGYKLASNELKAITQRQLFHGLRTNKQEIGKAFNKQEFIEMPLYLTSQNLYIGFDKYNQAFINFFWGESKNISYAYFGLDSELRSYGKTNKNTILANRAIKISQ